MMEEQWRGMGVDERGEGDGWIIGGDCNRARRGWTVITREG